MRVAERLKSAAWTYEADASSCRAPHPPCGALRPVPHSPHAREGQRTRAADVLWPCARDRPTALTSRGGTSAPPAAPTAAARRRRARPELATDCLHRGAARVGARGALAARWLLVCAQSFGCARARNRKIFSFNWFGNTSGSVVAHARQQPPLCENRSEQPPLFPSSSVSYAAEQL